jgi:hypothetical protein
MMITETAEEADSDSEKSLSTNENTFPSGPCSPPETTVSSPPNEKKKEKASRSYEVTGHEIIEICGLVITPQLLQSASPNLYKQAASKRQKISCEAAQQEPTPTRDSVKKCLFS